MKTAELIRNYIEKLPRGEPFTPMALLQHGTRKAVDMELSRLVKNGKIMRVARGVYVRPKENKYVGKVPPGAFEIAQIKAGPAGVKIALNGAEAALLFGLSTQVPVQPVYYTTGPSKRILFGNLPIRLRHISPRKLVAPGTNVGLAISALWYLGRKEVNTRVFEAIQQKLTKAEYAQLKASIPLMPAWMADKLRHYEKEIHNG